MLIVINASFYNDDYTRGTKSKPPSFPVMLIQMQRTEGIKSWYSGLSAALMRQAVYGTARIGLHRKLSDYLIERNGGKPIGFFVKVRFRWI